MVISTKWKLDYDKDLGFITKLIMQIGHLWGIEKLTCFEG